MSILLNCLGRSIRYCAVFLAFALIFVTIVGIVAVLWVVTLPMRLVDWGCRQ